MNSRAGLAPAPICRLQLKVKIRRALLGRHFVKQGWHFQRALVSPLLRTRQTAEEILAQQLAAPNLQIAEFLREVDYGPDDNMPEPTVIARIGEDAIRAWEQNAEVPPGWIVEPATRMAAWRELFAESDGLGGPTLLVTSNGAARYAILAEPHLREKSRTLRSLKLPTGGYGIISCTLVGRAVAGRVGSSSLTSHTPKAFPALLRPPPFPDLETLAPTKFAFPPVRTTDTSMRKELFEAVRTARVGGAFWAPKCERRPSTRNRHQAPHEV